jgi:hypothetical protein
MLQPPPSLLLLLHEQPTARAVHDNPPLIVSSPRLPRVRTLAARVTRARSTAADVPAHCLAARRAADCEEVPASS